MITKELVQYVYNRIKKIIELNVTTKDDIIQLDLSIATIFLKRYAISKNCNLIVSSIDGTGKLYVSFDNREIEMLLN